MHGFEGDLLVVLLRGKQHEKENQREALRSLGLNRVGSASLRRADSATWGYVDAVSHVVGVIELGGIYYKEAHWSREVNTRQRRQLVQYEKVNFGTNTRPGQLCRDSDGQYVSVESDRKGALVNWSTRLSCTELVEELDVAFERSDLSGQGRRSVLGVIATDGVRAGNDPPIRMQELETEEALGLTSSSSASIIFARLAFAGLDLTWHSPYKRFEDRDTEFSEAGVYSAAPDISALRQIIRRTGDAALLDAMHPDLLIRENGRLKQYEL